MELLTLILVNLVTAIVMYFIFSLRFSKAVSDARKAPVLNEMRENIEAAIEFINTSLDLIDRKNKSFYQMLRRSEEILKGLEAAQANLPVKKTRKKTTKKTAKSAPPTVPAATEPAPEAPVPEAELSSATDAALERALSGLGADKVQLTPVTEDTEDLYKSAEASVAYDKPEKPAETSGVVGVVESTGKFIRKLFGMNDPVASTPAETTAPPREEQDFERFLERVQKERAQPPKKPEKPVNKRTRTMEDILELSPAGEALRDTLPTPARTTEPVKPEPNLAQKPQDTLTPPEKSFLPEAREALEPEGALAQEVPQGIGGFMQEMGFPELPPVGPDRTRLIRLLIQQKFSLDDISLETGISRPELELVASLPEIAARPRRKRKGGAS